MYDVRNVCVRIGGSVCQVVYVLKRVDCKESDVRVGDWTAVKLKSVYVLLTRSSVSRKYVDNALLAVTRRKTVAKMTKYYVMPTERYILEYPEFQAQVLAHSQAKVSAKTTSSANTRDNT